ncbi:unnamed protein product [Periconia digitata]|uniref:6-phosphogluconate dehydrogenase C-terminal domain-like protein n=1 Tax=Periconia digitata TaxID=1303443 RepID=A0A9W4UIL2_9PLEO|nr:unnamed protein product [Periconia digitata]
MSTPPLATIAIISIGQMGLGIARLLRAHSYRIITNITDRSPATLERAKSASIELFPTDASLVREADYILSIVPPRDAVTTAQRIISVFQEEGAEARKGKKEPLYYLELNAIAPRTVRTIGQLFHKQADEVRFVDGGIIGGPPSVSEEAEGGGAGSWTCPGIPLSGPYPLTSAPISGSHLASTLHSRYLNDAIGTASALKCSFAALSKGFAALSLQAYSTAASVGVLPHLQEYLDEYGGLGVRTRAERGVTGCPGKAYRWVEEMRQIGICFGEEVCVLLLSLSFPICSRPFWEN